MYQQINEQPQEKLLGWILQLLERSDQPWREEERFFLSSFLRAPRGAKSLARMATTYVRLKNTGMRPAQMGDVGRLYSALDEFWQNPSAKTYRKMGIARW